MLQRAPSSWFLPFVLLLFSFAGCESYDFASAKTPTGEWDVKKLIADLNASGEEQLSSGLWIPLLYLDLTTFQRSDPLLPDGYTLKDFVAVAPLFCAGAMDQWVVDEAGAPIEESERWWLGWGLLVNDHDERVETPHGVRYDGRFRWLGLLGRDSTVYVRRDVAKGPAD